MTVAKAGVYAKRAQIAWLVAIVVVAAAIYIPSLFGKFLRDDNELIIRNPASQSLSNLPKAFSTYFLYGFRDTEKLYYRPLITLSFQINNSLAHHNPFSCRLTNLLLNLLMGVGVFLLAKALTKKTTLAGAAALAFVVMPCHTESVAWISGRTDVIAALFMVAAFLLFLRCYSRRPEFDWRLAALASLMFACALFSKEMAMTLPLLIGVYVLTLGASMKRSELLKWLPAVVIPIALYMVCRRLALGAVGDDLQMGYLLKERMSRVAFVYAEYLRMMFVPQEARPVYDDQRTTALAPIILSSVWLVLAGLTAFAIWARKRAPILAFSVGWLLVSLLPVADIVPMRAGVIGERFAYLPSIGAALILGWLFSGLVTLRPKSLTTLPFIVGILGAAFAMYCGAVTVSGCQAYSSNLNWAWWVHANKPRASYMRLNAAGYLQKAGYSKEAAEEFEASLDIGDDGLSKAGTADLKYKLGLYYVRHDDFDKAARAFADAVRLDPKRSDIWLSLAKANVTLERYQKAVEAYERADALRPLGPADRADFAKARGSAGN